jgi:acetyl/propionyl-CoA carboxylase alpha subunit
MIAKLIAFGRDREEALGRLAAALEEFTIAGIRTSLPFLRRLCENEVFRKGAYDTAFIENEMGEGPPPLDEALCDLVLALVAQRAAAADPEGRSCFDVALPKIASVRAEVSENPDDNRVRLGDREITIDASSNADAIVTVLHDGAALRLTVVARKKAGFDVGLRDRVLRVKCAPAD